MFEIFWLARCFENQFLDVLIECWISDPVKSNKAAYCKTANGHGHSRPSSTPRRTIFGSQSTNKARAGQRRCHRWQHPALCTRAWLFVFDSLHALHSGMTILTLTALPRSDLRHDYSDYGSPLRSAQGHGYSEYNNLRTLYAGMTILTTTDLRALYTGLTFRTMTALPRTALRIDYSDFGSPLHSAQGHGYYDYNSPGDRYAVMTIHCSVSGHVYSNL